MTGGVSQAYLSQIFRGVEEALGPLQLRCFVVGAFATQFWYDQDARISYRTTRDIDIVVGVPDYEFYETVLSRLDTEALKEAHRRGRHTLILPDRTVIDLLPFQDWDLAKSGYEVHTQWGGPSELVGFHQVANAGLRDYEVAGRQVRAASPVAIVGLKLFALHDRPEHRLKDAADIGQIIKHYAELESETIYDRHLDLFGPESGGWDVVARMVLGRELHAVFADDAALTERIAVILAALQAGQLAGLRYLAQGLQVDSTEAQAILSDVSLGFRQNWTPSAG